MRKYAGFAIVALVLAACRGESENGFSSSRSDYMEAVKREMIAEQIPFRVDKDGAIRYSSRDQASVERIRAAADQELSCRICWTPASPGQAEEIHMLLAKRRFDRQQSLPK